ncbi:MAG: AHBA synthesis associated protein [bacterium]|nr:MAG: AHBA synthesis associated protein [bacterium]
MAAYERGMERMPLFPGIEPLLDTLADQGVVLAICTGRGRPSTDLIMRSLRLNRWFEVSVTGEEVARPKPWPDGILETLRRLELGPSEVLYVGDSVKDVEAGLAAGTLAAAARWGSLETNEAGFARAALQARHPRDILAWWERNGSERDPEVLE